MKHFKPFLVALGLVLLVACGTRSPIDKLQRQLDQYPEYSIILDDMDERGNFFKDYYQRYKIVFAETTAGSDSLVYRDETTDWYKVDKRTYKEYLNYLGMVIASKTREGGKIEAQYPPGYQYVGNAQYGQWVRDERGNSFWEWYGKYAFFSSMFGMFGRPIYRNDWNTYRDYSSSGRPYYGKNREYGTTGTYTKQTKKAFFERQRAKEAARKARFSDRVKRRTRRSKMSGFRSRSFRGGK